MSCYSISVIIPNYNHAKFLKQRLDSVLSQTLKPLEIIVLDDCSTDNSVQIIEEYLAIHPQISFINNEANSGSTFAQWNKGVSVANGNLIWIAESDDTAEDTFLEKLVQKFDDNKISIAFCQSNKIDVNGVGIGYWNNHTADSDNNIFEKDFEMNGFEFIDKFLIHKNCIPNASGVIFKKEIYIQTKGANVALKSYGDWLVWLQLLCKGNIVFVAEALNNFRFHSNSVIAKASINKDNSFRDIYGLSMRYFFLKFLKENRIILSKSSKEINNKYFALDTGYYGLYLLANQKKILGWKKIIQATFIDKPQTYFIKKALGFAI